MSGSSKAPPSPMDKPFGLSEPYHVTDKGVGRTTGVRESQVPGVPLPGVQGSPIELTVVRSRGATHSEMGGEWVAVELWTQNRIYLMDGEMRCRGVWDRRKRANEATHRLMGAVLTGGQRPLSGEVELSRPFPLPGMKAVFKYVVGERQALRFAETSVVERVVLRLGVTTLDPDAPDKSFHELTARFFLGEG